jgi:hypothetical protein
MIASGAARPTAARTFSTSKTSHTIPSVPSLVMASARTGWREIAVTRWPAATNCGIICTPTAPVPPRVHAYRELACRFILTHARWT